MSLNKDIANLELLSKNSHKNKFPKHGLEQTQLKNRILIKQAIEDLLVMSKLQRMKYITINNKNLFIQGKLKRTQWLNRKSVHNHQFLPDLPSLKVQQKSPKQISNNFTNQINSILKSQPSNKKQENPSYEQLIERFIERVKQQKLLTKFQDKQQLVKYACQQIMAQIQSSRKQIIKSPQRDWKPIKNNRHKTQPLMISQDLPSTKITQYIKTKRSAYQAQYCDEIQHMNKKHRYQSKKRNTNERLFLRKIKSITISNKKRFETQY